MFLWRDDSIGEQIARELLVAADRGVRVTIEKDRYACLLEYAEECQRSFFHDISLLERLKVSGLVFLYNRKAWGRKLHVKRSEVYEQMKNHPHIVIKAQKKTHDHSKYYIFDSKRMILGGINIEDKELYADNEGRVYHDYMTLIEDPQAVAEFMKKRQDPSLSCEHFVINSHSDGVYEIRESYLQLINDAQKQLTIMMAYFVPDKAVIEAIDKALRRGVEVRIMVARRSNFINDANRLTFSKLMRSASEQSAPGSISFYMIDLMLHTKLLMNEKKIITGSGNITGKSFYELGELDVRVANDDSAYAAEVRSSVEDAFKKAQLITNIEELDFNYLQAIVESKVA